MSMTRHLTAWGQGPRLFTLGNSYLFTLGNRYLGTHGQVQMAGWPDGTMLKKKIIDEMTRSEVPIPGSRVSISGSRVRSQVPGSQSGVPRVQIQGLGSTSQGSGGLRRGPKSLHLQ